MKKAGLFGLNSGQATLLLGVMTAVLISSLDTNIVSTAMPQIVRELGGLSLFSWVFTAYLITSTVAIMVGGKLGDMWGRKKIYICGIAIFLAGSALSGLSQSMLLLIIFRGLQGIGGGIMVVSGMAITGEIFPPAERGKWQGMIGAVFAIASIIGPMAGGWITEYASWQWVFYVNIPIGLFALYFLWKGEYAQIRAQAHEIDTVGVFFFSAFSVLLIVWLVSGLGSSNPVYLLVIGASVVFLALFIWQERRAREPIMPLGIFSNRAFLIAASAAFIASGILNGVVAFLPLFMAGVLGHSATAVGNTLAPLLLSFVLASAVSGQIITKTGRYKLAGIIGCALVMIGLYLLSGVHAGTEYGSLIISVVVLGLGLGITSPLFIMVSQNAFEASKIGIVTSAFGFFRNLGSAVIVAVMGAMVNLSADEAALMPQSVQAQSLVAGISGAFFAAFAISAIPLALMLILEEIPLRKAHGKVSALEEAGIELAEEEGALDERRAKLGNVK